MKVNADECYLAVAPALPSPFPVSIIQTDRWFAADGSGFNRALPWQQQQQHRASSCSAMGQPSPSASPSSIPPNSALFQYLPSIVCCFPQQTNFHSMADDCSLFRGFFLLPETRLCCNLDSTKCPAFCSGRLRYLGSNFVFVRILWIACSASLVVDVLTSLMALKDR